MRDYVQLRPGRLDDVRQRIRTGQLAVCGGHYGNVRSTHVGNETFIRNIQRGMAKWKEFCPEVAFRVYADMDVTLGHTQMPQLLSLAGYMAYYAGRPIETLDEEGVPRNLLWKGLSGDEILMCRGMYGGLFLLSERHGPTWDTDLPAVAETIWTSYSGLMAQDGVADIPLSVGCDDTRPERFLLGNDEPADYPALMALWNERMPSQMRYSTPDEFFAALATQKDKLQVVQRILDPTDVSYNTAYKGRRGIWWLRELCDRRLVEAETLSTLASLAKGSAWPEAEFITQWENYMDWTPHAVQFVFRQDWNEGELALMNVIAKAEALAQSAASQLVDGRLPMDSSGIAVVNPVPGARKEVVPLWLISGDLERDFTGLADAQGWPVEMQVANYPVNNSELELLAEVSLPGCGYTTLTLQWEPAPRVGHEAEVITNADTAPYWKRKYNIPDRTSLDLAGFELVSDRMRLSFVQGKLVRLEDLATGLVREAPAGTGFLEPVYYPASREIWGTWLMEALPDEPEGFVVTEASLDEAGPLRWRVTLRGTAGNWFVMQHIDLYKGEAGARSTLQFFDSADITDAFIALAMPLADEAKLTVDIPFGFEERNLKALSYGRFERMVPNFFWGRTWVSAEDAQGKLALLAADGDRFWRHHGDPKRLIHFVAQKTRLFEKGWEAYTDTYDVGGRQRFEHRLLLGEEAEPLALVATADQVRQPIRSCYVPATRLGEEAELVSLTPPRVRLSALTREGEKVVARLVNLSDKPAQARLGLPGAVASARLLDFRGDALPGEVTTCSGEASLTMQPWQVATLEITPAQAS